MVDRVVGLVMVAYLLTWQTATPVRADEEVFWGNDTIDRGNGTVSVPFEGVRQDRDSFPQPADRGGDAEIGRPAGGFPQQPPPAGGPPVFEGGLPRFYPASAPPPPVVAWDRPVRLPRTEPLLPTGPLMPPADGTWREDGRYVIITLDGREMRLLKAPGTPDLQNSAAAQEQVNGGTVVGRLLNKGRPLVSCQVAIMPLERGFSGYSTDKSRRRLASTTDEHGVYRFGNVPEGAYKLSWLPAGENQWIRRIAARPDVTVRANESVHVKDIRVALRTIN